MSRNRVRAAIAALAALTIGSILVAGGLSSASDAAPGQIRVDFDAGGIVIDHRGAVVKEERLGGDAFESTSKGQTSDGQAVLIVRQSGTDEAPMPLKTELDEDDLQRLERASKVQADGPLPRDLVGTDYVTDVERLSGEFTSPSALLDPSDARLPSCQR